MFFPTIEMDTRISNGINLKKYNKYFRMIV